MQELSWPETSIHPLAKLEAMKWRLSCLCLYGASAELGAVAWGASSPSWMLLALAGVTHPSGDAVGGRTDTSAWGWNMLLQYKRLPHTTPCFPPFPERFKIIWCLFLMIHLLKCLCWFSGEGNKITRARIVQWGKKLHPGEVEMEEKTKPCHCSILPAELCPVTF